MHRSTEMTADAEELDISIVIPSFNRGMVVKETVAKCLALHPRAREIVLVDDHSNLESEEILRRLALENASVRYIRLPENGGQATSRSTGFATAGSKYIVSLDDDSWFMEQDGLMRVWVRMERRPECGLLAFNIFSPGLVITPPEDKLLAVSDHLTCGAAYRSEVLRAVGFHLPFLRFVGEEVDLSLKIRDAGFEVVKDMSIRCFHDYEPARRSSESLDRVCRFGVRNDFARTIIYFPWSMVPALVLWKFFSHLRVALSKNVLGPTIRGYWGFLALLPQALRNRRPVSMATARRYLRLRRSTELLPP
jgi:glycosyltransferase involved in cell wall biosynthesis